MRKFSMFLLLALALPAHAQPWEGWFIPVADGWAPLRFGMDRESTARRMDDAEFATRPAREGTLRFEKRIDGQIVELIANFQENTQEGVGGELYRIQVSWNRLEMPRPTAMRLYQRITDALARVYGQPIHEEDDGIGALDGGRGHVFLVFQGPEMQAMAELKAIRPNQFALYLTLDSPQFHPELPGG